jgi:hypothetical protein
VSKPNSGGGWMQRRARFADETDHPHGDRVLSLSIRRFGPPLPIRAFSIESF